MTLGDTQHAAPLDLAWRSSGVVDILDQTALGHWDCTLHGRASGGTWSAIRNIQMPSAGGRGHLPQLRTTALAG